MVGKLIRKKMKGKVNLFDIYVLGMICENIS